MDIFKRATSGDPIAGIPAEVYNALLDLLKDHKRRFTSSDFRIGDVDQKQDLELQIRNDTGGVLDQFSIVGLGAKLVGPSASDNFHFGNLVRASKEPKTGRAFAVVQRPARDGDAVKALASGLTLARVNVVDPSHQYAKPADGDYLRLLSTDDEDAPASIYNRLDGDWCLVILCCQVDSIEPIASTGASLANQAVTCSGSGRFTFIPGGVLFNGPVICSGTGISAPPEYVATGALTNHAVVCSGYGRSRPPGPYGYFVNKPVVCSGTGTFKPPNKINGKLQNKPVTVSGTGTATKPSRTADGDLVNQAVACFGFGRFIEPTVNICIKLCNEVCGTLTVPVSWFSVGCEPEGSGAAGPCGPCASTQSVYCIDFGGATCTGACNDIFSTPIQVTNGPNPVVGGDPTPCHWYSQLFECESTAVVFSFYYDEEDDEWKVDVGVDDGDGGIATSRTYSASAEGWDCNSPLTLTDTEFSNDLSAICSVWPETITVTPGACGFTTALGSTNSLGSGACFIDVDLEFEGLLVVNVLIIGSDDHPLVNYDGDFLIQINSTGTGSGGLGIYLYRFVLAVGAGSGTITITPDGGSGVLANAYFTPGDTVFADTTASDTGSSMAPDTGTSGTATAVNNVIAAFSLDSMSGGIGSLAWGGGFTGDSGIYETITVSMVAFYLVSAHKTVITGSTWDASISSGISSANWKGSGDGFK